MSTFVASRLPLAPLGAGALIDRAVRLYRRHLFTLIGIAWRAVFVTSSGALLAFYFFVGAMGVALIVGGYIFSLIWAALRGTW